MYNTYFSQYDYAIIDFGFSIQCKQENIYLDNMICISQITTGDFMKKVFLATWALRDR